MKEGNIKVLYRIPPGIDDELDDEITDAFERIGYTRWTSGFDVETGVRDITFEPGVARSEKNVKAEK